MSHISKPVDWEVFSIPPIQPVQYYSILKKQREFSQLIKQYDAQVFRHGYLHYCGIVPKYLNSSVSNRYEIFIVFLGETPTTSFIGFRVKVCKDTFTYESKSLLLFLRNSEKAVFYSMNNNHIHVHCGTNAWELFYLLYDDYLKRYVLTIIGTQFFYHFVYSYCIEKEKQFLKLLNKGSKVIRISKSSIYYKICRKRKISVTDLIHMTLNMPKRKKSTLSCFNSKKSLLYSDVEHGDFYTIAGNKISVSKLMLKKYKKQDIVPEKQSQKIIFSGISHKRKFDEIDTNQNLKTDTSSKHFKTSEPYSTENQWKQYQKFESYTIKSYSTISFINPLVPNLLKNGNSSCNSNLPSVKTHSNNIFPLLFSSDSKKEERNNSTVIQEACASRDNMKAGTCENSKNPIEKASLHESKSLDLMTFSRYVMAKDFSTPNSDNHENLSYTKTNPDLTKSSDINLIHTSKNIDINKDGFATEDVNFTTAAGKVINVSSEALLKAYELCKKPEILSEKNTSSIVKYEVPDQINYLHSKRKYISKEVSLPKMSENKHSQELLFFKSNQNMPKKLAAAQSSNIENLKLDNSDASEDVTFSTAAGKTITVSSTAMEAAHKLINKSTDEEKMSLHSENLPVLRNQFYKNEISNNGCTSKGDDVDMDNTLVEKFFEDVQFDEKEIELTKHEMKKDNSMSKNDKNLPIRKPRKSLGGRRSMRDCSDKL